MPAGIKNWCQFFPKSRFFCLTLETFVFQAFPTNSRQQMLIKNNVIFTTSTVSYTKYFPQRSKSLLSNNALFLFLQAEASKEMYRAVMLQVVTFLERAHRNLQSLGTKAKAVQRTHSDHHLGSKLGELSEVESSRVSPIDETVDYTAFRDFTW